MPPARDRFYPHCLGARGPGLSVRPVPELRRPVCVFARPALRVIWLGRSVRLGRRLPKSACRAILASETPEGATSRLLSTLAPLHPPTAHSSAVLLRPGIV